VTQIPEPEIRAELDRILASKGFAGAGRISKLLRFAVDKTLAGETDQLKEYSVGIEVFDRDGKYDPRLDSIVRVEAGRLRSRLDDYYHGEGAASAIRIRLPKGGYVAQFDRPADEVRQEPATVAPIPEHRKRSRAAIPLAAGLICAVAAMVVWLGGWNRQSADDRRPIVAVLPFESNVAGNDHADLSRRMTEAVTSELARLGTVGVASYTSAMQFSGQRRPLREIASSLNARFVVEASIDSEVTQMLVVTRIVNAETDRKVWVSDYRGAFDDVRGIAQRMAFDISAALLKAPQAP
jgi:adenylate cyclase